MIDMQGILSEYLPLQLIYFGDVYADEDGDPYAFLNEYDFIWQPISENRSRPHLFLGEEVVRFKPESGKDKVENLNRRTGGNLCVCPKFQPAQVNTRCWSPMNSQTNLNFLTSWVSRALQLRFMMRRAICIPISRRCHSIKCFSSSL